MHDSALCWDETKRPWLLGALGPETGVALLFLGRDVLVCTCLHVA